MFLTPEKLFEIKQIIADYHNAFILNALGEAAVSPEILARLKDLGLVDPQVNSIEEAYVYGQLLASLESKKVADMTYPEFKAYIQKNPVPLTASERYGVRMATLNAGQYARGLGNRVDVRTGSILIEADSKLRSRMETEIKTKTSENIARRETTEQLKSDLGWATRDWARDWKRIAVTEKQTAMQQGLADSYTEEYGPDVLVAKIPQPDACEYCVKLHLGADGHPRIFKLADLENNGTNVGKKAADWQAVTGTIHPHCMCNLIRIPPGWGFNEDGDVVPGGAFGVDYEAGPYTDSEGTSWEDPEHNIPWKRRRWTKNNLPEILRDEHAAKSVQDDPTLNKGPMLVIPLSEDLEKGGQVGGKYTKRVPYTDKHGKRKYRYYYAESAVARDVHAGEKIRLGRDLVTVDSVDSDGTVHLATQDKKFSVKSGQWDTFVAKFYGVQYYKWAEKRSAQSVNAVLKHVPREQLGDLKGGTDKERLADLKLRVPAVYAKLQKSFSRAGVNPFRAKQVLSATLSRRGWDPEARAVVIGDVITKRNQNYQTTIRAAENLAGGQTVKAGHVGAASALATSIANPEKDEIAETAVRAESELAKLSALLAQAKDADPEAAARVLAAALSSTAIQQLNLIAKAFPGTVDKAIEPARKVMLEVPSVAPKAAPKATGSHTQVFVAGEGGAPQGLTAKYKLVEADEAIASHDPRSFNQRTDYPEGVQERAYHRDKAEQAKVQRNAQRLKPEFVVNTNPDAVNGPPIMGPDGVVLGGNSRTMSIQLAYAKHPEKAGEMRDYLTEHAHEVGFSKEDVQAFKNPILVRVLDSGGETKQDKQLLVRQMNESFTQAMDPRTMQVAMGRKLTDATVEALGQGMEADESLNSFLSSSRAAPFINELTKAGIIDQRNSNQYFETGVKKLNSDGRTLVARILVGRMVGDADLLSATAPSTIDNLARVAPYLAQAKSYGAGYDLGDDAKEALSALNGLQRRVADKEISALKPDMKANVFDNLFAQQDMFGEAHPITQNKRAMGLLEILIRRGGSKQIVSVFKDYADQAQHNPEGQGGLLGAAKTPAEVFNGVVQSHLTKNTKAEKKKEDPKEAGSLFRSERFVIGGDDLAKAGPYIGPRGGKWADPQHKIPWKEPSTKSQQLTLDWTTKKVEPLKTPVEVKPKKASGVSLWGNKLTPEMVNQIRKDMRSMSKMYRAIKIPEWNATEGEKAKWLGEYQEAETKFRIFGKTVQDWAYERMLEEDDEEYSAQAVRETFWRIRDEMHDLFPVAWNPNSDAHEPSAYQMKSGGDKALKRMQVRMRDALKAAERYIADKGGEIDRNVVSHTFNQDKVNYVVYGRSMDAFRKGQIEHTLSTVHKTQQKLKSLGLGTALEGLVVHMHAEKPSTVANNTNLGQQMGGLVAGWYTRDTDTLRLFPLGHDKDKGTLIHEIGHRVYYKLLSPQAITTWEKEIAGNNIKKTREHIDMFIEKFVSKHTYLNGDEKVVDIDAVRAAVAQDTSELKPVYVSFAKRFPVYEAARTVKGMQAHYHQFFEDEDISKEFVSDYARTNPAEMFAEVFRDFVTKGPGSIPPWTLRQFRSILRSGGVKLTKSLEDEDDLEKAGPYIGPRGGKWADPQHTIPWQQEAKRTPQRKEINIDVHAKVGMGGRGKLQFSVVGEKEGQVLISRHADSKSGTWIPKESVKHLKNDLEGKVDLPKSGRADIDAVIAGKAEFLGKGDDGLAFKVGGKVVKVSTTVPYQPENSGHLTPKQASDRLKKQVEVGNNLADIEGVQRSEFVEHGDKGFQIKDWVEIPKKFTREQLDTIQKIVIEVHKKGYAVKDDVQAGLDKQGKPVLFDIGKAGKQSETTGMYSDVTGDMDNLSRLYRDSGESFVRLDVDESMQYWQKFENTLNSLIEKKAFGFTRAQLKLVLAKREKQVKATLKGEELEDALEEIDWDKTMVESRVAEAEAKEKEIAKSLDANMGAADSPAGNRAPGPGLGVNFVIKPPTKKKKKNESEDEDDADHANVKKTIKKPGTSEPLKKEKAVYTITESTRNVRPMNIPQEYEDRGAAVRADSPKNREVVTAAIKRLQARPNRQPVKRDPA